jgi:ERCC4-related helicase
MIFSQFRESVYEIKEVLSAYEPLVKVMEFVGQSTVSGTRKSVSQKEQMEVCV